MAADPSPPECRPAWRSQLRLLALRTYATCARPFTPSSLPRPPRKVLILRPDHIGDALFTTPALSALRRLLPQAEITCLVGPWAADVYERNPNVDRVRRLAFPGFGPGGKRSPLEPYSLLRREAALLANDGYDLALNLRYDFWWGVVLAFVAGIPSRLGYAVPECAPFLTEPLAYSAGRHEVAQNLALVAALAARGAAREEWLARELTDARLEYPVGEHERAVVAALCHELGARAAPLVAIHPGTRGRAKLWTAEGWGAVADSLAERHGVEVLVTGSAAEEPLCRAVASRTRSQTVVLAGRTTLGELVGLFARCSLVLGVDSGPLHLAVAAGVPTVHLYGPSDHVAFAPFGDPNRQVTVRAGRDCSPCHQLDRPPEGDGYPCMQEITPALVLAAAERALAGAGRPVTRS
ncbi:MAG: glycosyltransferase family 9 protein [Chloroflexi bacterium]|nr:glycosyltransferase family 9 protein [Chloroflexota bacterium]MCL5108108.1 glycosyltransferase family 9 protein [Chloroflexota bacterium]